MHYRGLLVASHSHGPPPTRETSESINIAVGSCRATVVCSLPTVRAWPIALQGFRYVRAVALPAETRACKIEIVHLLFHREEVSTVEHSQHGHEPSAVCTAGHRFKKAHLTRACSKAKAIAPATSVASKRCDLRDARPPERRRRTDHHHYLVDTTAPFLPPAPRSCARFKPPPAGVTCQSQDNIYHPVSNTSVPTRIIHLDIAFCGCIGCPFHPRARFRLHRSARGGPGRASQ